MRRISCAITKDSLATLGIRPSIFDPYQGTPVFTSFGGGPRNAGRGEQTLGKSSILTSGRAGTVENDGWMSLPKIG